MRPNPSFRGVVMNARVAMAIGVGLLLLPGVGFGQEEPADGGRRPPAIVPGIVAVEVLACHAAGGGDPMPGSANDPVWRARHPGLAAVYAASCSAPHLVAERHSRLVRRVIGAGASPIPARLAPRMRARMIVRTPEEPGEGPGRPR